MILIAVVLVVWLAAVPPPWNIVLVLVGCALEAVELVLLRRWAKRLDRRTAPETGNEALVGAPAEVVEACDPTGMVHVRGELWEARCDERVEVGEIVRVESSEGLTLVVARSA